MEAVKQNYNPKTIRWLARSVGKRWAGIAVLALLSGAGSAVSVAYAWAFRAMIDSAVARDAGEFRRAIVLLVALLLGRITINTLTRFLNEDCLSSIENRLKQGLFRSLLSRDYALVTTVHSGNG